MPRTPKQKRRKGARRHSGVKRKSAPKRTPVTTKPKKRGAPKLPETPAEARSDEVCLRKESCALCPGFKRLSRTDLRHKRFKKFNLEDNCNLLKLVQDIFPHYALNKKGVPVVLCYKHYMCVRRHNDKTSRFNAEFIDAQDKKFKNAKPNRKANKSTPLSKAHTATLTNPVYPLANILHNLPDASSSSSDDENKTVQESPLKMLRTPERKPRGKSKRTKRTPELTTKHVVKAAIASNLSGSQLSKHTEALRSQKGQGHHNVNLPSGETARKERSELNKVFWEDFKSVPTRLCPDNGAAQVCTNVEEFLYKTVYARSHHPNDVALLKFNLDGGRGSQKLVTQYLFDDDPTLSADATEEAREAYMKQNGGLKDTGVMHTLILGLMKGGKETFEVTRFFFDGLISRKKLEKAFPNAQIFLPNDLKQDNLASGMGPHSSRNPLHSNHYSPWRQYSDPAKVRTGKTLLADLKRRREAQQKGKDASAKLFNSVETEPIKVLLENPFDPVGDILCPPALHLNLGVASHVVECAQKLDPAIRKKWELGLGVKREEKRGGKRTTLC